jgi:hypothetical protein
LLSVSLGSGLAAQGTCFYVPDNVMSGGNVIPFGSTQGSLSTWGNQKYHTLILPADVNNQTGTITSLGFGGGTSGSALRHHDTIQIRMDYFQGTGTTMSTTFAQNISANAVTVLESTNYAWTQVGGVWNRIGLQKPFTYVPALGPLVVEITLTGSYIDAGGTTGLWSGSRPRMYARSWVGTPPPTGSLGSSAAIKMQVCYGDPDLHSYSEGCVGSNSLVPDLSLSGSASLGGNLTIGLANAPANSVAFLAIGLTAYTTPVDLVIAGAPGCRLFQSLDVVQAVPTDASGAASVPGAVPNVSGLVGLSLFTQFAPLDPTANSMGMTVSDFGRILIGL